MSEETRRASSGVRVPDDEVRRERSDDTVIDSTPPVTEEAAEAIAASAAKAKEKRLQTLALNEDDIEELRSSLPDAAPTPIPKEESGEVVGDEVMIEEVDKSKAKPPAPPPSQEPTKAAEKQWFETIFDEDYLRTLPYLTPQVTKLEADFVKTALDAKVGSQILDLGCGYGRHAMELAAHGMHVVGLDLSLPLLLRGADEAQRRGLNIHFVHGDMRELAFDGQFDGGYCLFSTFGYFEDKVNKACLQSIFDALKPGAKFVFQILNRDYLVSDLPSRVWWEGDSCVVLEEVEFNYFSSRVLSNRSVVFDDGRQLEQEISFRVFSLHEIGNLLHDVGFRITDISGTMLTPGRFLGVYSREIVLTVERPE